MLATQVTAEMKKGFVIDRLLDAGVTHSQEGISIYELSYEDLKYELVLQAFREIDVDNSENVWF